MYRLDVRALSFASGSARIVKDVSLSLQSGELVALLGPSGCGKSTLLRAIIGFRQGSGRVELCGRDLYGHFDELKTLIGFVPQDDVVHGALGVRRTLEYAAQLRLPAAMPDPLREATIRQVLAEVDLTAQANLKVKNLSGGQRKRVSLAVELLAKPPLLFLDEPTSGLDPALEEKTMGVFRALTGPDRLTVVTTHVLSSLDFADLVLMMARGRVVFVGPPKELPAFFGAPDLASVYRLVSKGSPEHWVAKLQSSSLYKTYVVDRLARPPPPLPARRTA